MWKQFEEYLIQNRQALDVDEPPEGVWNRIQERLAPPQPNRFTWRSALQVAAVIVILVGAGYWWMQQVEAPHADIALSSSILNHQQKATYPALQRLDSAYVNHANELKQKINTYSLNQYDFVSEYRSQIAEIERMYTELKAVLNSRGYNDSLHLAIQHTYDEKIKLLEQMLERLELGR